MSHNQITGHPCNAFTMYLSEEPPLPAPAPDNITWTSIDLSYNCIYLNESTSNMTDFYQPAGLNCKFVVVTC